MKKVEEQLKKDKEEYERLLRKWDKFPYPDCPSNKELGWEIAILAKKISRASCEK